MWYFVALLTYGLIAVVMTIYWPATLANIGFLKLYNYNIVVLIVLAIAVILVHYLLKSFDTVEKERGKRYFDRARKEIKSDVIYLLGIFIIGDIILITRSQFESCIYVKSILTGAALMSLFWAKLIFTSITRAVLAFRCPRPAGKTGLGQSNDWVEITTPYLDRHNDYIQIYVRKYNGKYHLSDDGYTIDDLELSGYSFEGEKEKLLETLSGLGVQLVNQRLEIKIKSESLFLGLHNLVQAIYAVSADNHQ